MVIASRLFCGNAQEKPSNIFFEYLSNLRDIYLVPTQQHRPSPELSFRVCPTSETEKCPIRSAGTWIIRLPWFSFWLMSCSVSRLPTESLFQKVGRAHLSNPTDPFKALASPPCKKEKRFGAACIKTLIYTQQCVKQFNINCLNWRGYRRSLFVLLLKKQVEGHLKFPDSQISRTFYGVTFFSSGALTQDLSSRQAAVFAEAALAALCKPRSFEKTIKWV